LGIGYETTNDAIWGRIPVMLMVILILLKIFATAVTYASRFGGGVFSPALLLGALTGGVFGVIATGIFPDLASDQNVYSILGMGAIAATVIGAPISTTVIVFELTGGYALSIALLFTIAVSHGINQAIHGRSFFQWQLEMRGLHVRDGPYKAILAHLTVQDFMVKVDLDDDEITLSELNMIGEYPTLSKFTSMDMALQLFDRSGHSKLPVIDGQQPDVIIAWAEYSNAINLINNRLIETQHEEHN
jgi:CIC family chloride channel protein